MLDMLPPAAPETAALRRELHDTASAIGLDKLGAANVVWWDAVAADAEGDLAEFRRLIDVWASQQPAFHRSPDKHGETVRIAIEEGRLADAHAALPIAYRPGSINCADVHSIGTLAKQLAIAGLERDVDTAPGRCGKRCAPAICCPTGGGADARGRWCGECARGRPGARRGARRVRQPAVVGTSVGRADPRDERRVRAAGRAPHRRRGRRPAAGARHRGARSHPTGAGARGDRARAGTARRWRP